MKKLSEAVSHADLLTGIMHPIEDETRIYIFSRVNITQGFLEYSRQSNA